MQPCTLLSLATAVPPQVIAQPDAKALGRRAFAGKKALFDRLSGVFDNAGIARRNLVAPAEWYEEPHGWSERNRVYLESAEQLFEEAASAAIEQAGLAPDQIDGVVTVSTTGIATPSLEARVGPRMGLRSNVRRVPIFGMGCAGGVNGLGVAARLAGADPGSRWLFVTVETCSISIRLDSDDPAAVVATALFGDGAAAAVLQCGGREGLATIVGSAEKMWPQTLEIMGWQVEDPGLAVLFDRAIPPFIEAELHEALEDILRAVGQPRDAVARLCCHPGGVKVIESIERALDLTEGALDLERDVLRDHGNMSSPTVLFVLERLIEQGLPKTVLMTAFGPGFTCAGLLLDAA